MAIISSKDLFSFIKKSRKRKNAFVSKVKKSSGYNKLSKVRGIYNRFVKSHTNVDFANFRRELNRKASRAKSPFYVFQFNKQRKGMLNAAKTRWIRMNTINSGISATADAKEVLLGISPANRKIMEGKNFRNLDDFNKTLERAAKEVEDIQSGNISKNKIISGLKKMKTMKLVNGEEAYSDAEKANIDKVISSIEKETDQDAMDTLANFRNKADWYEEHKEELQDIKQVKDRVELQAEKGKSINSTTLNKYIDAMHNGNLSSAGQKWFASTFSEDIQEKAIKGEHVEAGRYAAKDVLAKDAKDIAEEILEDSLL